MNGIFRSDFVMSTQNHFLPRFTTRRSPVQCPTFSSYVRSEGVQSMTKTKSNWRTFSFELPKNIHNLPLSPHAWYPAISSMQILQLITLPDARSTDIKVCRTATTIAIYSILAFYQTELKHMANEMKSDCPIVGKANPSQITLMTRTFSSSRVVE